MGNSAADYYADFRYQSSSLGRFFQPDPYAGSIDFTNPQSLNRYSYVMNDPIGKTDPLGLYCTGEGNDCGRDWGNFRQKGRQKGDDKKGTA